MQLVAPCWRICMTRSPLSLASVRALSMRPSLTTGHIVTLLEACAAPAVLFLAHRRALSSRAHGASQASPPPSEATESSKLFSLRPETFAQPLAQSTVLEELSTPRVVFFGEIHAQPAVVAFQRRTALAMLGEGTLHVILEHFSFEQQHLLDAYAAGELTISRLLEEYDAIGTEGHDIVSLEPLLSLAREQAGRVRLHGGFIPRPYARIVMRESTEAALAAARAKGYVAEGEACAASEAHYSFFESLISGRDPHDSSRPPSERFRKMFPAQVIKDAAMAHKAATLAATAPAADKLLLVLGLGHCGYGHGVPERLFAARPELRAASRSVHAIMGDPPLLRPSEADAAAALLGDAFGAAAVPPADYGLLFADAAAVAAAAQEAAAAAATAAGPGDAQVKSETALAYDRVGDTAQVPGNVRKAQFIMARLGYSPAQVATAGADIANFQGVGTPHGHAALRPGEAVLDLGSGLGIDSFIAAEAVGPTGRVTGLDLAKKEVRHAASRAKARGLDEGRVRFLHGDLEQIPLDEASVDAVISNGAFCLAPDKAKAFAEVRRVLRPGGRFAVCTSTLRQPLEESVQWPVCMRMFAPMHEVALLCEAAGLVDVKVDDSDAAMQFELPEEAEAQGAAWSSAAAADGSPPPPPQQQRNAVHVGSPEFRHLQQFDMNALCARVVVTGRRPQ